MMPSFDGKMEKSEKNNETFTKRFIVKPLKEQEHEIGNGKSIYFYETSLIPLLLVYSVEPLITFIYSFYLL